MRIRSSLAANSVKVMAAIFVGAFPPGGGVAPGPAKIEVLPDPAPASTRNERSTAVSAVVRAARSGRGANLSAIRAPPRSRRLSLAALGRAEAYARNK